MGSLEHHKTVEIGSRIGGFWWCILCVFAEVAEVCGSSKIGKNGLRKYRKFP
jgi:hypothetical protein